MVTYFDLTRLKRTEEALFAAKEEAERANQAKSAFLASMSHELRTPMNAIIGFTRLVMRHGVKVLSERDRSNLEKILASANHLLGLINDILDLSKIEAGRTELKPTKTFIGPLIEECLRTIEPIVPADRVRLKKDVATDASVLFVDREKLNQILMNLLGNAAKFIEQGSISVVARKQTNMMAISVIDTGIGIRKDLHEHIFEEFSQIEGGSKRHVGTELGLAISRRLARLMGGDITLESELGMGSTFTVVLPIDLASTVPESSPTLERPQPVISGAQQVAQPANGKHHGLVLAIDDDPDVIDLLRQNLVDAGYHVEGALSGSEGLSKAREFQPSAITLDIKLLETDGWQVLHCLKTDLVTCNIPVILLTVVDQKSLGYRLGASEYLVKPFDRGDLLTALSRVVPYS